MAKRAGPGGLEALYGAVRDVPDFPKPGIVFKDITPVLLDPKLLGLAVNLMASAFRGAGTTRVVAIESRGFLLAPPIALALGAGLVPVRKPGKLPAAAHRVDYALEYGTDALEMHRDALGPGERVLVVDDVLATGGTAAAAVRLVRGTGADLVGLAFLIELDFLHGRRQLEGLRIEALLHY